MKFKILGTEIQITFIFTAFTALLLVSDKSGFFLPMLASVVLHEAAHLFTMYLLGCNPKAIRLIPASVRIVRDISCKTKNEVLISLSGPLINLFLFAAFYIMFTFWNNEKILTFAVINLIIGAFNLLPVKGLDGGVILKKVLAHFYGENWSVIILNIITAFFGVAFFVLGTYLIFGGGNFSLVVMSLYLLISVLIKL